MSFLRLLATLFWLSRSIRRRGGREGSQRRRRINPDNHSWIFPLVWIIGGTSEYLLWRRLRGGHFWAVPIMLVVSLFLFPWAWVRRAFIPLGWYRLAYRLTFFAVVRWGSDYRGGQGTAAALALLRHKNVKPEQVDWIETKMDEAAFSRPLRAGGVVARALIASRVDRDDARRLMRSVSWLDRRVASRLSRRLAREWLACEAAERGDWHGLAKLEQAEGAASPLVELLVGVARRLLGDEGGPGISELRVDWLLSPGRARSRELLRRARHAKRRIRTRPARQIARTPLASALHSHARLLARPAGARTAEEVIRTGLAWETAFAGLEAQAAVQRNAALQLAPSDPITAMRDEVVADLAAAIRESHMGLPVLEEGGELVRRVALEVREELLGGLELAATALGRRVNDEARLPAIDEWRSYAAFREEWDRAIARGGPDLRRVAFAQMHRKLCPFAVHLFNERGERPMGNAIFQWLLREAKAVGDAAAVEVQTKNAALRPF